MKNYGRHRCILRCIHICMVYQMHYFLQKFMEINLQLCHWWGQCCCDWPLCRRPSRAYTRGCTQDLPLPWPSPGDTIDWNAQWKARDGNTLWLPFIRTQVRKVYISVLCLYGKLVWCVKRLDVCQFVHLQNSPHLYWWFSAKPRSSLFILFFTDWKFYQSSSLDSFPAHSPAFCLHDTFTL